jgi:hypothetical protein
MIGVILGALAIAAAAPVKADPKDDPAKWVRASDLPKISDNAAVTTFDLTIDQTGKSVGCEIIVGSGRGDLDEAVCRAVLKRARFRPALDASGSTIHSVRRDRVIWKPNVRSGNKSYDSADLVVNTPEQLPRADILAEVLLVMTESGDPSECIIATSSGAKTLDEIACKAATDPKIASPVTDAAGQNVAGIRSLFVTFTTAPTNSVELR